MTPRPRSSSSSRGRAGCPFCGTQNEFTISGGSGGSGPIKLRCANCSNHFQTALPRMSLQPNGMHGGINREGGGRSSSGHSHRHNLLQICRHCGTWNQFPRPGPDQPMPDVLCGACGTLTPVTQHARREHQTLEQILNNEIYLNSRRGLTRHAEGPMIQINVGGQRRTMPLSMLLALMAQERDQGNPAQVSDIAALPTRKLGASENLGEQSKCLICLDEFNDGDDVKTLPCLHIYHQRCIERWLSMDNSCPACKTPIGDVHYSM